MTLGFLKNLTKGLLIGDNALPGDNTIVIPLVAYSYSMVANNADALHLLTLDRNDDLIRTGSGEYFIRTPNLPEDDNDELDIDDELVFAVAEYLASKICKEDSDKSRHENDAGKIIRRYNEKVEAVLSRVRQDTEGVNYVK